MQRNKLLFACLSILIIASFILSGCQQAKQATIVTITWIQEFDSLNPAYTNMWFSTTTQDLWNSWAWEFDENSQPFPKLVTEIPSEENGGISADGKTITMHIKDGIKWSDGTPLTSADFKFTQEMYVSPNNAVNSAYPYDMIDSIDTPDDKTVVINFTDPFAPWLALLWHGLMPAHILQPVYDAEGTLDNAAWNSAPTVGLGPYVFDKWETGSYARFVKNDNYWGTPANIDEVFFRFVPDQAAQITSLQAGDADLGYWFDFNDAQKLKDAGFDVVVVPNGYNEGIFFLMNNTGAEYDGKPIGNPALLDVNVRKAIAMGIDRESLNQRLNLGYTTVPASFWDSFPTYNNPPLTNYPYDPEGAKALLDAAGWVDSNGDSVRDKDGVELVLTYGTTNMEKRQNAQVVVQEQLASIGIKVNIQSYESDLFFGSYDQAGPAATGQVDLMEWSDAPLFPDPDIYYWYCDEIPTPEYPAGSNWFFMCDEKLDSLMALQTTQVDLAARQQTISEINQIFYDQVYWLGMWQDPDDWAVGSRLSNVKFSPVNPLFNIAEWTISQ
jgi:peptide/nickel transport system substrate-binding protein